MSFVMKMKKRKKGIATGVLAMLLLTPSFHTAEAAEESRAQEDLQRQQEQIRENAAKENYTDTSTENLNLQVKSVRVEGQKKMSEGEILNLIPSIRAKSVNIHKLSQELQMVNDNGAMKLSADFRPDGDGFNVVIKVEEKETQHLRETISNTGDEFTGDWRMTTTYINTNTSNQNDTLGVSYVTSPGHWGDVQQVAMSYRIPQPKSHGSWNFAASYAKSDLGTVYSDPQLLDLSAKGESATFGLHYLQNVTYTSREKDMWDFGIDHKRYSNDYVWNMYGVRIPVNNDFNVSTASVSFIHSDADNNHAFNYDVGGVVNFDGHGDKYDQATPGSDKHFSYIKANASYMVKNKSDWRALFKLHGQYTNNNLVSTEQIGAGGIYSVRGFTERALSADTGLVGSFELYTPEFLPHSRLVAFLDAGDITNNNSSSLFHHERIASAGIGYRYTTKNISLLLDYAYIIDDADDIVLSGKQAGRRWNFAMNVGF